MFKLLKEKKNGNMEDILATSIVLLVIIFIVVSMVHFIKIMECKRQISAISREYLLILEKDGYLIDEEIEAIKTSVSALGFDKSHISVIYNEREDGSKNVVAGYGEEVNLTIRLDTNYKELGLTKIDGIIKENYTISKTVYSTSKQ